MDQLIRRIVWVITSDLTYALGYNPLQGRVAVIPNVTSNLRARIGRLIFGDAHEPLEESDREVFADFILPDIRHFRAQAERFRERSVRPYVAVLYDEDDSAKVNGLDVPIRADDLNNMDRSYLQAMKVLDRSKIQLKQLPDVEAMEAAFVDRLTEAAAQMFAQTYAQINGPMVVSGRQTTVNSNRSNDTILYAKGYFLSTGTAFGVSTPATAYLVPSRYSFGIMDSGGPRFENIVWSCPADVRLKLP
jgi:hypothetical protein